MLQHEECSPGKAEGCLSKAGGRALPSDGEEGRAWGKLTGGRVLC